MVYPFEDGYTDKYSPGPMLINFVDQSNVAISTTPHRQPRVRVIESCVRGADVKDRGQHSHTDVNGS